MKAVIRILVLASLTLAIGVAVAYYQTSSLGYDNANILSFNREGVSVFAYDIDYAEVREKWEQLQKILPQEFITI